MTKQELINTLNETEAERVRWMTAALTAGNEVAALEAQVNCLREVILKHPPLQLRATGYEITDEVRDVLDSTPEQCLAEVKAKAIEDAVAKMINACVKYSVEKYINTSVEMVSVGQLKHLSEVRHHREWEQAK